MKTTIKLLCLAALLLTGCERKPTVGQVEAIERSNRIYANAMDDLQAGRIDAAIKGLEKVTKDEPCAYSAHFQLASLLQDHKKDYLEAIIHYRMYMALRPNAEKNTMANERMQMCLQLMNSAAAAHANGKADSFKTDNEKLIAERDTYSKQITQLRKELDLANNQVTQLTQRVTSLHKILQDFATAEEGRNRSKIKDALAQFKTYQADADKPKLNPTDADLLDDDSEDGKNVVEDRIGNSSDIGKLRNFLENEERRDANSALSKPLPKQPQQPKVDAKKEPLDTVPQTYVVQQGDTLFKISTRFYGTKKMWSKIRDLNKAVISTDGRIKAGQLLQLPRP